MADALEKPVELCSDDLAIEREKEKEEDLERCLASISYLAHLTGYNPYFECSTGTCYDDECVNDWDNAYLNLQEIILAVLQAFDSCAAGYQWSVDEEFVEEQLALLTARERLETRTWLHRMFVKMNIDPTLIDNAFPVAI
jgi:hypothetical protein